MSKFENERAEQLYQLDPDEQVGSSSDGLGWAGIFKSSREIIFEATDGFVQYFKYEPDEDIMEAWRTLYSNLDQDPSDPSQN